MVCGAAPSPPNPANQERKDFLSIAFSAYEVEDDAPLLCGISRGVAAFFNQNLSHSENRLIWKTRFVIHISRISDKHSFSSSRLVSLCRGRSLDTADFPSVRLGLRSDEI